MKMLFRRGAAVLAAAGMTCAALAGCGSQSKIDGTQTVLTVNDETVDLGVLSFFAKFQQAETYAMASYYGSGADIFNETYSTTSSGSTLTVGDSLKNNVMESVEQMVLVRQHAADYGVSLTDEEEAKIEAAAQDYIDSNTEEARALIGASKEDVINLMELQQIESDMLEPLAADVDTNVTDDEAQQTTVSYITIAPESASDSTSAESDSASSAASVSEEDADAAAQEKAAQVLAAVQADDDPDGDNMTADAQSVDEKLSAVTGQFTTNDTTDTYLDSSIVEAVQGLEDGQVVDHVITSSTGSSYYVVRLLKNFDEDYTESKKSTIVVQRKQDNLKSLVDSWRDASTITINDKVWDAFKIDNSYLVSLKEASSSTSAETESTASSGTSDASSITDSAASDMAEGILAEGSAAAEAESASASEPAASGTASSAA